MFKRLFKPTIRDATDLWRYVFTVMGVCVGTALSIDVVNQLSFFADWQSAFRSWVVTLVEAGGLSLPISLGIGRTNLELYHAQQIAEKASRTDHLTGLLNRRALMDAVSNTEPYCLALVIADIDWFKRINDTHGHLVGDCVISAVGKLMADELSDLGALARVGGEEFALLVTRATPEMIEARLEAARRKIAESSLIKDERAVRVTVSIGWATSAPGDGFQQLYGKADRALYLAKASGRDRLLRYDEIEVLTKPVHEQEARERREAKSA